MSIFDKPPATNTSNIFGHLANPAGAATSAQPQQSQSATSSIFGNLGGQQQSQPSQPSIFANLGSSQGQQSHPTQSSMFSGLGSSQPQQSSSIFGAPKPATTQSPPPSIFAQPPPPATTQSPAPSIFAQAPQQQQQNQQSQSTQQPPPPPRLSQPAYFESLLEKGRKRTRDADSASSLGDLPALQLGLSDIARRVREIGGVGAQSPADRATDSKGHYLLAASGINPGTTRRDLDALQVQPGAGYSDLQVPAEWDPDTNRYMDQMQQQSTLKMISEGIERAHRSFDAYLDENIDINWEAQRKKIYEHFGLAARSSDRSDTASQPMSPGVTGSFGRSTRRGRTLKGDQSTQSTLGRSIFGQSSLQKSVIGTPNNGHKTASLFTDVEDRSGQGLVAEDRFSREKQGKFAEKVQALNRARLQEKPYPIFHELRNVQMQPGGEVCQQVLGNANTTDISRSVVSVPAGRCLQRFDRHCTGAA